MFLIDGIRIPILIIIGGMILFLTGLLGMDFARLDTTSMSYSVLLPEGIPPYILKTIFQLLSIAIFFWGGLKVVTGGLMLASYYLRGKHPHFVIVFPFNKNTSESLKEIARCYMKEIDCNDDEKS